MNIKDIKYTLEEIIYQAVEKAVSAGALDMPEQRPAVETPKDSSHGDFSANAAMIMAKKARRPPRDVAKIILDNMNAPAGLLSSIPEIVGPGFINFRISPQSWLSVITRILDEGDSYGRSDIGAGERIMVEFVSANPTGPLHIGHARNAAIGDTFARILDAVGYKVYREFYINDAGNQVDTLAKTLHARWLESQGAIIDWGKTFGGGNYYPGEYVTTASGTMNNIIESPRHNKESGLSDEMIQLITEMMPVNGSMADKLMAVPAGEYDTFERFWAVDLMREEIRRDLLDFGVEFDNWFSEYHEIYGQGLSQKVMDILREKGDIYEKDGATWFRVGKYISDEEDRVVKKSTGEWTYFAGDIAYHWHKLNRGFKRLVNVWGADHHGYIGRVKASIEALGLPPERLDVLLVQMVNLVRGGEQVRMGKRTGEFVTLREVMDEVGKDAMRFTFLTRSSNSHLDFDIDVLKAKPGEDSELKMSQMREKNPVYYVQYAHARCNAIFRKALESGFAPNTKNTDLSLLDLPEEIGLARRIEGFPREVALAATCVEPHRISHYLIEVAGDFHRYYYRGDKNPSNRVITENADVRNARLALVEAVKRVIRNGLDLLGVDAPDRM